MYMDRDSVRDIANKVRTSEVTDNQARQVCAWLRKQKATYYHDCIAEILARDYETMMNEKHKIKRG